MPRALYIEYPGAHGVTRPTRWSPSFSLSPPTLKRELQHPGSWAGRLEFDPDGWAVSTGDIPCLPPPWRRPAESSLSAAAVRLSRFPTRWIAARRAGGDAFAGRGSQHALPLVEYASTDAGKTAYYALRWVNTASEHGPWSATVSATIPG